MFLNNIDQGFNFFEREENQSQFIFFLNQDATNNIHCKMMMILYEIV